MLRRLTIALAALLVLVVGGGMLLPAQWEVTRSIVIPAPAAAVHPWIADPARWHRWSPPERPAAGPAVRITSSDPARGVWYDFLDEDLGAGKGVFLYEEDPGGTRVTATIRCALGGDPWTRWRLLFVSRGRGESIAARLAALAVLAGKPPEEAASSSMPSTGE